MMSRPAELGVKANAPGGETDKQAGLGPASDAVGRVLDGIDRLSECGAWASALCILGILTLIVAEVVARNIFNKSIDFAWEFSAFLMGAAFMLGAAYSLRTGSQVRVKAAARQPAAARPARPRSVRDGAVRDGRRLPDLCAVAFDLAFLDA